MAAECSASDKPAAGGYALLYGAPGVACGGEGGVADFGDEGVAVHADGLIGGDVAEPEAGILEDGFGLELLDRVHVEISKIYKLLVGHGRESGPVSGGVF